MSVRSAPRPQRNQKACSTRERILPQFHRPIEPMPATNKASANKPSKPTAVPRGAPGGSLGVFRTKIAEALQIRARST